MEINHDHEVPSSDPESGDHIIKIKDPSESDKAYKASDDNDKIVHIGKKDEDKE